MTPDMPTEEELLAGRSKDGSRPPLHSPKLYRPQWDSDGEATEDAYMASIPGGEQDDEDFDAEQLKVLVLQQELEDIDAARNFERLVVELASKRLTEAANAPPEEQPAAEAEEQPAPEQAEPVSSAPRPGPETRTDSGTARADMPGPGSFDDLPGLPGLGTLGNLGNLGSGKPKPKPKPVTPGSDVVLPEVPFEQAEATTEREAAKDKNQRDVARQIHRSRRKPVSFAHQRFNDLPLEKVIVAGQRAGKNLIKLAARRTIVANLLIKLVSEQDKRTAFMWDRAHGVVAGTLLHLDKHFEDAGFGAWMPFRFPDQWLMFCGVLRRVLAANGLIHSQHADVYRRLLDETPPVDYDGPIEQRIKSTVPKNWGRCWRNRGANNMAVLKQRLHEEYWNTS
jgi:hypothetical protein